jgi:hypothetical protein
MSSLIVSMGLALSLGAAGQTYQPHTRLYANYLQQPPRWVLPPGPGLGWGFANGNPDGYGFFDVGDRLPLGADRTSEYYFRRYYSVPVDQMFMPNYYNPYVNRGQRYLSYSGCAPGYHPAGGLPTASVENDRHPYNDTLGTGPRVSIPSFSGRIEAGPVNSGGTGLTP